MLKRLFNNIPKGWKTTLLGLIFIFAPVVSVFIVSGITWTEAIWPVLLGLGLLFSPDDIIKRIGRAFSKRSSE